MKNKKILIVFAFLFLFVLCIGGQCSAAELNHENVKYILPNDITTNNYFICKNTDGFYVLNVGQTDSLFKQSKDFFSSNPNGFFYKCFKDNSFTSSVNFDVYVSNLKNADNGIVDFSTIRKNTFNEYGVWKQDLIYSTTDVIAYDGSIFFQGAPLGVVAQKVQGLKLEEVMKEIVLILPLIIVTLVSLVGLRKALKTLSMLLHRA